MDTNFSPLLQDTSAPNELTGMQQIASLYIVTIYANIKRKIKQAAGRTEQPRKAPFTSSLIALASLRDVTKFNNLLQFDISYISSAVIMCNGSTPTIPLNNESRQATTG